MKLSLDIDAIIMEYAEEFGLNRHGRPAVKVGDIIKTPHNKWFGTPVGNAELLDYVETGLLCTVVEIVEAEKPSHRACWVEPVEIEKAHMRGDFFLDDCEALNEMEAIAWAAAQ